MTNYYDKIEDYLLGDLPEAERGSFETALQSDTELAKAVAQQRALMQRLDALRLRKKVQSVLEEDRVKPGDGIAKRVVWSLAVLLVILAAAFWVFNQTPPRPKIEEVKPPPTPSLPGIEKEIIAEKEAVNPPSETTEEPKTSEGPKTQTAKLLALAHRYHIEPEMSTTRDGSGKVLKPLQAAQTAYQEQHFALALKLLTEMHIKEQDEEAVYLRGSTLFNTGQFAAAARDFKALENSFQFKQEARWNYLQCQLALGNLQSAKTLLQKMLADPDYAFRAKALELKEILKF